MKKIFIIDAYSFIYRFYFAYKNSSLMNKQGVPTAAILGFTKFLLKTIEDGKPDYLVIAFDVAKPTFRLNLYSEYKKNRLRMPDDLEIQIPYIKSIVKKLGIKTVELAGYEADDIIATLSAKFLDSADICILTGDKDIFQLVSDKVKVQSKDGMVFSAADVKEKFGVFPENVSDKLALMGDASDNVPGVKGIGGKTAEKLVNEYGSLEKIYDNLDKITAERIRELLKDGKETAFLSKKLVVLNRNLPLEFKLDDFKLGELKYKNVLPLFKELEFNSIISQFNPEKNKGIERTFQMITEPEEYESGETNYLFLGSRDDGMDVIIAGLYNGRDIYIFKNDKERFIDLIGKISGIITAYDIKRVFRIMQTDEVFRGKDVRDLLIGYWLLSVSRETYDFSKVVKEYIGLNIDSIDNAGKEDVLLLSRNEGQSVANSVYALYLLYKKIDTELISEELYEIYFGIEKPLIHTLYYMERIGIKVDKDELSVQKKRLDDVVKAVTGEIYEKAGEVFNINSTKQLQQILYGKLGIKPGRRIKTGYSTDEKTLAKMAGQNDIIKSILNYREVIKLLTTYINPLPQYIACDGRVHTTFNQVGTITGRLSSENPNMQNIPARSGFGRDIRKIFVAQQGFKLVSMDYSQIELRILAHFSHDSALIESFNQGKDIHTTTAVRIFGIKEEEVTSEMRRFAKIINFSIIYGKTRYGLAADLKISVKDADKYIRNYFSAHSGVSDFLDKVVKEAQKKGYVRTMYGRIRFIPEIHSDKSNTFSLGKRYAINTIIQGTAADIIKIAMNRIYDTDFIKNDSARMLLQIHDELVFEIREDIFTKVIREFREIMENVDDFLVPLTVGVGTGDNWYETK